MNKTEKLMDCFSFMDLTTLHTNDTEAGVKAFVEKLSILAKEYPTYPMPASVCVFSNFASVVRDSRPSEDVHVTVTSACFPTSQSFLDVKLLEVKHALEDGADEVDIVLNVGKFLGGQREEAAEEIREIRKLCKGRILKVILETGVLRTPELIRDASMLAMEAGADFIKTSTGKVEVNATPEAARVMCLAIKDYFNATGRMVGFKAAGGISTADEALEYYEIVSSVLGEKWLKKDFFRLGVSRLGNSLMSAIEGREIKFF